MSRKPSCRRILSRLELSLFLELAGADTSLVPSLLAGEHRLLIQGLRSSQVMILKTEAENCALTIATGETSDNAAGAWMVFTGSSEQFSALSDRLANQPFGLGELGSLLATPASFTQSTAFTHRSGTLAARSTPLIMGILNVTPDSFSDGGSFEDPRKAIEHGLRLVEEGADILDIGGQSTRPGAAPVGESEEAARVLPVISGIAAQTKVPISVDTWSSAVASLALNEGASIVNDVSACSVSEDMARVVAAHGAGLVLMHMLGEPRTMQSDPRYGDVTRDIFGYLQSRLSYCISEGVPEQNIALDPGICFGKTLEHNLELLRNASAFRALGRPVVIGHSRKSFIGAVFGGKASERDPETVVLSVALASAGTADIIRVHDVRAHRRAFDLLEKLAGK